MCWSFSVLTCFSTGRCSSSYAFFSMTTSWSSVLVNVLLSMTCTAHPYTMALETYERFAAYDLYS